MYQVALKEKPAEAVPFLKHVWQTTAAPDGKEVCLQSMSQVYDPAVITGMLLPWLFGLEAATAVPSGDMHILAAALAGQAVGRPLLWRHIRDNWHTAVVPKIGGNPIVLDRFVRVSLSKFSDLTALAEIEAFFADKDTKAFDRTLETVKDSIRGRAAYRRRDAAVLREWLVANGYA